MGQNELSRLESSYLAKNPAANKYFLRAKTESVFEASSKASAL